MTASLKIKARELLDPVARFVADIGISPTAISIVGFGISTIAGVALACGHFLAAGLLVLVAGICDMADGAVARAGERATSTGAFLDSTLDRYSELVVLLGALVYYMTAASGAPEPLTAAIVFVGLGGSFLVSYTRARAEAIGVDCQVGFAERPERLVLIIIGALLGPTVFRVAIWILAILSHITAAQRIRHVVRTLAGGDPPQDNFRG
ncbi:CDP-alcohol phosphatidyltransferase family protein [bacterium]|nr:CDP-alcohol phosphatidyltransferase family protein [bacterium]